MTMLRPGCRSPTLGDAEALAHLPAHTARSRGGHRPARRDALPAQQRSARSPSAARRWAQGACSRQRPTTLLAVQNVPKSASARGFGEISMPTMHFVPKFAAAKRRVGRARGSALPCPCRAVRRDRGCSKPSHSEVPSQTPTTRRKLQAKGD